MPPRREYPALPVVGVETLIHKGDTVLLLKRTHEPNEGKWSLPAGLVRLGETVEDAVRREAKEQLGLEVNIDGMLDVQDDIHPDGKGVVRFHYVQIHYLASPRRGKVVLSSDASEYRWFTAAEVRSAFASENTKRAVQKYLSRPLVMT